MSRRNRNRNKHKPKVLWWLLQIPHLQTTYVVEENGRMVPMTFDSELHAFLYRKLAQLSPDYQPRPVFERKPQHHNR